MVLKLTQKQVLEKFKIVHGDRFDYSLVKFRNTKIKVKIICRKHGIFQQVPNNHMNGQICKKCAYDENTKNRTQTSDGFIIKASKIHKNKYDYSLVKYIKSDIKVIIRCPFHGNFKQTPDSHINQKSGCPQCKLDKFSNDYKLTNEEFINRARKVHKNKYNYDLVEYDNNNKKIKIICRKHELFEQKPSIHLCGSGCTKCSNNYSQYEKKIENWLKENKIEFISQHKFEKCRNIKKLPFDFYLPDKNMCIEFDGIYHYKPIHGVHEYKNVIKRDKIKTKYCIDNNIKLIRISYMEKEKINEILFRNIT